MTITGVVTVLVGWWVEGDGVGKVKPQTCG